VVLRARLNNPDTAHQLRTDLVVDLEPDKLAGPYPGRVRVVLPTLQLDGTLKDLIVGLEEAHDNNDLNNLMKWAKQQRQLLKDDKDGMRPHNQAFVQQQLHEIDQLLAPGTVILEATATAKPVEVRRIPLAPGASHPVFLLFDLSDRTKRNRLEPGQAFNVDVRQYDADQRSRRLLGGLSSRIEFAWPAIYHPG
jgi:hypothetical protein